MELWRILISTLCVDLSTYLSFSYVEIHLSTQSRSLMFTYIYQLSQINQFATCIYRKSYCSGNHVEWNANLWCSASRKFQLSGTRKVRVSTSLTFKSYELRISYVWSLRPSSSPSILCLEIILTDLSTAALCFPCWGSGDSVGRPQPFRGHSMQPKSQQQLEGWSANELSNFAHWFSVK